MTGLRMHMKNAGRFIPFAGSLVLGLAILTSMTGCPLNNPPADDVTIDCGDGAALLGEVVTIDTTVTNSGTVAITADGGVLVDGGDGTAVLTSTTAGTVTVTATGTFDGGNTETATCTVEFAGDGAAVEGDGDVDAGETADFTVNVDNLAEAGAEDDTFTFQWLAEPSTIGTLACAEDQDTTDDNDTDCQTVTFTAADPCADGLVRVVVTRNSDDRRFSATFAINCIECTADADCDNGTFCDGAETCVNGDCAAGTAPCDEAAGETCDEDTDTCVGATCTTDADCPDNGTFCDGTESCVDGNCESSGNPCNVAAGQTCNEATDACDGGTACTADVDCDDSDACTTDSCVDGFCTNAAVECDDGLFCNGAETCDSATGCVAGDPPCDAATETCDEETDTCTGIETFVLTTDLDSVTGTDGNDEALGNEETYNSGDELNMRLGDDSLHLTFSDANSAVADATELEHVLVRNFHAAGNTLNLSFFEGLQTVTYDRGDSPLTFSNVQDLVTVNFTGGDGADSDLTVDFTGSVNSGDDDSVNLSLDDADGDTVTLNGFETINVEAIGENELIGLASDDLENVVISGAGSLTIGSAIANATNIDASASAGETDLIAGDEDLTFTGGSGNDTLTFGLGEFNTDDTVDGGGGENTLIARLDANINNPVSITNFGTLSIQGDDDDTAEAFTLDLDGTTGLTSLRLEGIGDAADDADDLTFDNLTPGPGIVFRGNGLDQDQRFDSPTIDFVSAPTGTFDISFNNQGDDDGEDLDENDRDVFVDSIDVDGAENIAIAIADGGNIIITDLFDEDLVELTIAAGSTLTITNALESTVIETVDASESTGGVSVHASNSAEEMSLTGGAGDDTLEGGTLADDLEGGDGDDTLNGGPLRDEITGGDGSDTIQFDADNDADADADNCDDFEVGGSGDVIAIDVSAAGGGDAANLVANALVAIAASADNSFIVDSDQASVGYATVALAKAAVEAVNANNADYALMFYNSTTSRVELYIDDDSADADQTLLLTFENIDNIADARDFLGDFVAANYSVY